MNNGAANNDAVGAAEAQLSELEAAVDRLPRRITARQWISRLAGISMAVSAVITAYFGPSEANAEPVLGLTQRIRTIVHTILNGFWGLTFILYTLYGRWSKLPPFQEKLHRLVSISVVGISLRLDVDTANKIPSSFYPLVLTLLVEAVYLCVKVTSRMIDDLAAVLKTVANWTIIVWNAAMRRFNIAIRVGRIEHA